jgi:CheY-like chemotaxis protein
LRVLVVDDDYDARDVFTRALEQYDARVTAVASAGAALVVLQHWKPHVVVSDIAMPEESGYVLMRAIRGLTPEEGGMIPALALTAYAGADDVKRARRARARGRRSRARHHDVVLSARRLEYTLVNSAPKKTTCAE